MDRTHIRMTPLKTKDDDENGDLKPKSRSRCLVIIFCIVLLILLIAVIGLCIWFFVFRPTDKELDEKFVLVNVNVTLNHEYVEEYEYPFSDQYRKLERQYVATLDGVVGNNKNYEDYYEGTTISEMRPGSVEIVSWVFFHQTIAKSLDNSNNLRKELINTLSTEIVNGRLGLLPGDILEFHIGNPIKYHSDEVLMFPSSPHELPANDNQDIFDTGICGTRPAFDPRRLINGNDAVQGEMPWTGQLTFDGFESLCGATLLNEYWAVTAAHCVYDVTDTIYLVFGDPASRERAPSTSHRQVAEAALVFVHPNYTNTDFYGYAGYNKADLALLRLLHPVKYSDYVSPACITTSFDELNEYQQCRIAGWGIIDAFAQTDPTWLQIATVPLWPMEECSEIWKTGYYSYDVGFSSHVWFDEGGLICAGIHDTDDIVEICKGDSGSSLVCLGENERWEVIGVVSFGSDCLSKPGVYTRVSNFRDYIWHTRNVTDSCLLKDNTAECLENIGCIGGSLCRQRECVAGEFYCRSGDCVPLETTCNGYRDCYDDSDEGLPLCYDDCGKDEINISIGDVYNVTSLYYPDLYPDATSCNWVITSPLGTRVVANFNDFYLEDYYDFLYIGHKPAQFPTSFPPKVKKPEFEYHGPELPPSFVSPHNKLYVTMISDSSGSYEGFSMTVSVHTENEELPPLCGDNFQVFAGESAVCDGTKDCLDNSDEAPCDCSKDTTLHIDPHSFVNLTSPFYPDLYTNSLSCSWIVTVRQDWYILVKVRHLNLDVTTDALQISSATSVEDVFTYGEQDSFRNKFVDLYFETDEVVVLFQSDLYYRKTGFFLEIYETNGDDCIISRDKNCSRRLGCDDECYVKFCSNGVEVYSESWYCDEVTDCSDKSDEPEYCECGEKDIHLASGKVYELSSPVSIFDPSTYRQSSTCQWVITTSPENVLFAHFNTFDVEDGKKYTAYSDVRYGDYLYAGNGSDIVNSRRVNYTGSDIPLELETSGNQLVLTFVTDDSICYEGFSITIRSRQPEAQMKCANDLEILHDSLLCNGVVDCYGIPSDEDECEG